MNCDHQLSPEDLRRSFDPQVEGFETTEQITAWTLVSGPPCRALIASPTRAKSWMSFQSLKYLEVPGK
jgi:hypothetical protein